MQESLRDRGRSSTYPALATRDGDPHGGDSKARPAYEPSTVRTRATSPSDQGRRAGRNGPWGLFQQVTRGAANGFHMAAAVM
ncbi:hypothetical protein GCM10010104_62020 [Streptomyces indiaensis]|uniref:Uncharacterized protein n=1 Tax=Streptomyces indiaensis TaxID=284033 RepID=A0ABN3EFJ7_9ACTN